MASEKHLKISDCGGYAFPVGQSDETGRPATYDCGMSLRDYFAAAALAAALTARDNWGVALTPEDRARCAYNLADAMLAARKE